MAHLAAHPQRALGGRVVISSVEALEMPGEVTSVVDRTAGAPLFGVTAATGATFTATAPQLVAARYRRADERSSSNRRRAARRRSDRRERAGPNPHVERAPSWWDNLARCDDAAAPLMPSTGHREVHAPPARRDAATMRGGGRYDADRNVETKRQTHAQKASSSSSSSSSF